MNGVAEFNFINWIRSVMFEHGWTVAEFADNAGISRQAVYIYMTGKQMPTLYTFIQIVKNLGMQIEVCTPLHLEK